MNRITVIVADGHKLMRETISFILENDKRFNVVAGCSSNKELNETVQKLKPDIVLLEIIQDSVNGFDAIKMIHTHSPRTKVIGFSAYSQKGYVKRLLQCGGSGYITKSSSCEETIYGILEVQRGNIYICDEIKKRKDSNFKKM